MFLEGWDPGTKANPWTCYCVQREKQLRVNLGMCNKYWGSVLSLTYFKSLQIGLGIQLPYKDVSQISTVRLTT